MILSEDRLLGETVSTVTFTIPLTIILTRVLDSNIPFIKEISVGKIPKIFR